MEVNKFVEMIKKTEDSLFFGYGFVGDTDDDGKVSIRFDGNDTYTHKYYPVLNRSTLNRGDKVLIMGKDKNDLIILGVL